MTTTVTRQQYFTAVASLASMATLYAAVDANPGSAVWIEFYSAANVTRDDVLSVLTQNTFGWNSSQMDTLFATAAGTTGTPISNTLGSMRARIANEISRTDLTNEIALAISDAIGQYQTKRFYFNETQATFNTVANKQTYTSADLADIQYFYDIDDVFVTVGVNNFRVKRIDPSQFVINNMPNFKGQPYNYSFFNQQISFMPIPNAVYPILILGSSKQAAPAPASDSEVNNHWMTDAERLIRQAAKRILYQDVILDADAAAACMGGEQEALDVLLGASSGMMRNGYIRPMDF